jgi:flagellar biosynthesis protein FliQ
MILVLVVLSPWMLRKLNDYTHRVYDKIPEYARQK